MSKYFKVPYSEQEEKYVYEHCNENGDGCEDCPLRIGEDDCMFAYYLVDED